MTNNLVYFLDGKAYINITNACTNRCLFCIRDIKNDVKGTNLWLDLDNVKAQDVIEQLEEHRSKIKDEITFCGYGEPTLRFDELIKVAKYIKENFENIKIRINSNGHGSVVNKRNIVKEMIGLVDEISISLNAQNKELYSKISQPRIENAYTNMLLFAKDCVDCGIPTTLSVVEGYKDFEIDIDECRKIANNIGAKLKVRKWEENGY
ncbi:MAG: radical SAM protein [Cyanobacteria bacterium SIG30]|nr:radical SAM protein [Cyanobacteria bacterium SIG30]